MTKMQGWVLIGFVAIVLASWGLSSYNNSVQGKVNQNFNNAKAAGWTKDQGEVSCGTMCADTFTDLTDNQTCVNACEVKYNTY